MSDWQPITTAPKDGTRILAYQPAGAWQSSSAGRGERIDVIYWHTPGNPEREGFWMPSHRPTHWQPLPAPPRAEALAPHPHKGQEPEDAPRVEGVPGVGHGDLPREDRNKL